MENTKTAQYRAIWHEMKNFGYQSTDLVEIYRFRYTREPERLYKGVKVKNYEHLRNWMKINEN